MKIVIDTNVLLSALMKKSGTRKVIVKSGFNFYYPELSFHEVRKYKELVMQKAKLDEKEYNTLLTNILKHIHLVPEEAMKHRVKEANGLLGNIDPDDVIFLATAMSIENAIIWSDDGHFDHQDRIDVAKSEQMIK